MIRNTVRCRHAHYTNPFFDPQPAAESRKVRGGISIDRPGADIIYTICFLKEKMMRRNSSRAAVVVLPFSAVVYRVFSDSAPAPARSCIEGFAGPGWLVSFAAHGAGEMARVGER